jgi:xanthine dehydrogenase small subunit
MPPAARSSIEFVLNGERVSVTPSDPSRTALTWLREERGLVGTKEGCAEGDCGACTIAVTARNGTVRPVNSCILCLGALDGRDVVTVERLKDTYGGLLHPVQKAMVDCDGSQCGFCTPGFVMALYAHYESDSPSDRKTLCDAIAGNLCRCTGYRSILAAGEQARSLGDPKADAAERSARQERLSGLPKGLLEIESAGRRFIAPSTSAELAAALLDHPKATILAGGTDVGLWITKQHQDLETIVYLGNVDDLSFMNQTPEWVEVGASATYAESFDALAGIHGDFGELLRRLGSTQVRACGTLAGNVANGSPIGDTMPLLLALGATLELQKGDVKRTVALDKFYTGYRKNLLAPGEFIRSVRVPKLKAGERFAAYKLTKRFDQDISGVCAAFHVAADGKARFGFGGMSATPARAPKAEAAIAAKGLVEAGVEAACAALAEDFKPIDDMRASGWYRITAAQNLLRKFFLESQPGRRPSRVLEVEALE